MEYCKVIKALNEIFIEVFEDDSIVLKDETNANDIEDWDSLAQIILLTEIQKRFQISFAVQEITSLKNVGEMAALITRKLG